MRAKLLSTSAKTDKAVGFGALNTVLYLSPGSWRCVNATPGCLASCLNTAGRAAFDHNILPARLRKTHFLRVNSTAFLESLCKDLSAFERRAHRLSLEPVARLNGTSDLDFDSCYGLFPRIQFVEYTKRPDLMQAFLDGSRPSNLHVTFSRSERNEPLCLEFLKAGGTATVVFGNIGKKMPFPETYLGFPVVDGDSHDLRHRDPSGVWVGLRAKGRAKKDTTGFVVRLDN